MIRVGTMLHGLCGGAFGRVYECKRVEALGADWVVARTEDGEICFADVAPESLEEYTATGWGGLTCSHDTLHNYLEGPTEGQI